MRRAAPLVLIGSVVLLWRTTSPAPSISPAGSRIAPGLKAQGSIEIVADAPISQSIDQEVADMKARQNAPPPPPQPARNPFNFGDAPAPKPSAAPPPPAPSPAPIVAAPAPPPPVSLPKLIAIVAEPSDGGLMRTAIFDLGDDVRVVKPGQTIGRFTLRSIGADVIELADSVSGATVLIALR